MEFTTLFDKTGTPDGLCCLYLLPNQLIFTHVKNNAQGEPVVTFVQTSVCNPQSLRVILQSLIKKHNLLHAKCSWVLHANFYQLFLLDQPSVPETEIALALRWQLKELIHFPPENAAIEYFSVPSGIATKNKIFVAAAETSTLQSIADTILDTQMDLQYIDIPEFALRNINARYGDRDCYLGLIAFHEKGVQFIITHQKNILLSRQFTLPEDVALVSLNELATTNTPPQWLIDLTQEIYHSFTFCASQQNKELPNKLLVATESENFSIFLGKILNIATEQLKLEKKLNFDSSMKDDEYLSLDYLIAIGGALRNATN